ncbi:MAG TPA: ABC transporter permease [Polyangiales bacterium]|nr:ABC transporter permease [Polyangiales bacterium]
MSRFVVRRCIESLPTLFGVTLICFGLLRAASADPLLRRLSDPLHVGRVSSAALLQLRQLYDLDQPWYVQYLLLLRRLVTLDLGTTWQDGRLIRDVIFETLPVTLLLSGLSIALAYLIAVPLGVFAAAHRGSLLQRCITWLLFLLYSLPAFWLGTLLLMVFASGHFVRCESFDYGACFPLSGWHSFSGFHALSGPRKLLDVLWHLCLPVVTLSYPALAVISRHMRAGMLETFKHDFIRTARAKGLPESAVVWRHGLRHGILPIVTLLGLELPHLIGGAVVVEAIFGIRGMGLVTLEAIRMPDYPLVISVVMLTALMTWLGSLLADIAYAWLDPRVRYHRE